MKITYTLTITAVCPVDNQADAYECVISSQRTIPVEEILAAAKDVAALVAFQEDVTVVFARSLRAAVKTTGWHSGVKTEVEA